MSVRMPETIILGLCMLEQILYFLTRQIIKLSKTSLKIRFSYFNRSDNTIKIVMSKFIYITLSLLQNCKQATNLNKVFYFSNFAFVEVLILLIWKIIRIKRKMFAKCLFLLSTFSNTLYFIDIARKLYTSALFTSRQFVYLHYIM